MRRVCGILDGLGLEDKVPELEVLAREVGLTKHHFHRLFKRVVGVTPRGYVLASRSAARNGGLCSGSGEESPAEGGMGTMPATPVDGLIPTPTMFIDDDLLGPSSIDPSLLEAGKHTGMQIDLEAFTIYYSIVETTYGLLLAAFQQHEVCLLEFGASRQALLDRLETRFPSLYHFHCATEMATVESALYLQQRVSAVVEALEMPALTTTAELASLEMPEVVR